MYNDKVQEGISKQGWAGFFIPLCTIQNDNRNSPPIWNIPFKELKVDKRTIIVYTLFHTKVA